MDKVHLLCFSIYCLVRGAGGVLRSSHSGWIKWAWSFLFICLASLLYVLGQSWGSAAKHAHFINLKNKNMK